MDPKQDRTEWFPFTEKTEIRNRRTDRMQLIAAVDNNWAIGRNGQLLATIPGDMKFFREKTMGKTVIFGRKTMATFPGGKPLEGRKNIVLTRDPDYRVSASANIPNTTVAVAHSVEEAIAIAKEIEADDDDIFVIGGGSVYRDFEPHCDKAMITKIDFEYEADTFMPNLDRMEDWKMIRESEEQTCFDIIYAFTEYSRI